MTYDWYLIINKAEFEATGLSSRVLTVVLDTYGQKEILITKGNYLSVVYEETILSVGMGGDNPFERDDLAVYLDEATDDVYLGILNED